LNFNNNQAAEYLKQAELQEEAKSRAEKIRLEAKFNGVEITNNNVINLFSQNLYKYKQINTFTNTNLYLSIFV